MGNAVTWSSPVAARQKYRYLYKKKCETKSRIEASNYLLEFTDRQTQTDRHNCNSRETGRQRSGGIPNILSYKLPTTKHPSPPHKTAQEKGGGGGGGGENMNFANGKDP